MTTKTIPSKKKVVVKRKKTATPKQRRNVSVEVEEQTGPARVPSKAILDRYIGRTIGGKREFEIFDTARAMSYNVLIEGPTGPGKTTAMEAYAASHGRKFYAVPSSVGAEPSQLFGKMMPDGNGGWKWVDGPVTDIVRNGGVLLINEVNFLPERVAVVLFPLLDSRRSIMLVDHEGEVIMAHRPNCWCDLDPTECERRWVFIAADMNPEYAGTRPLNAAFRNRFAIQLWWDYDPEVEKKLIKSDALRDLMQGMRSNQNLFTPISTNMGIEFERLTETLGLDFAILNFVQHFEVDERGPVKQSFDAVRDQIERELLPQCEPEPEDDDDDDDFDFNDDDWMMGD